ncbi:MAG: tetratricopeptide repeat protein, partial [Lentisphaeria bacterium]|nr:tetratricopeptide repeat protein [Lentisphaeria bacterium]
RKTFSKVQIYVRDSYNRAGKLAAKGDYAGAVDILLPVIKANPEVPQLFERIREYEIAWHKEKSIFSKLGGVIVSLFVAPVAAVMAFINPVTAMAMCEGPLAMCVDNPLMLQVMALASNAADAPWGTVTALNVIRELHPNNTMVLKPLAEAMQRNNQAGEALRIHQKMAASTPNNLAAREELRSAMALASLERGRWEEGGTTQDKAKDSGDAVIQQMLEGTIHDADQAQKLIDKFTADLERADSVDIRRKLADAYMVAEKFEDAFREYETVAKKLGVDDPVLDKQMEKAYVANLDLIIADLESRGELEKAAETKAQREQYRADHIFARAQKFPNDAQLQFDLGELYFELGDIEQAREVFTKTSDFAQKKRACMVYLGRCALHFQESGKAIEFLETAIKDMYRMDKYKREALYFLGNAFELAGKKEQAVDCYKKILASMQNYRDVPQRMVQLTGNDAEQPVEEQAQ